MRAIGPFYDNQHARALPPFSGGVSHVNGCQALSFVQGGQGIYDQRMRNIVAGAACAFLLGLPATAAAEPVTLALPSPHAEPESKRAAPAPAPKVEASEPMETRWYGYQTLLADAASATLIVAGIQSSTSSLGWLGATTYLISGPAIHAANGNMKGLGGSIALRLGIPLGGALVGGALGAASVSDGDWGGWGGLAIYLYAGVGAAAGAVVASILDASVLARERVPRRSTFTLGVAPTRGGATIGAMGTF